MRIVSSIAAVALFHLLIDLTPAMAQQSAAPRVSSGASTIATAPQAPNPSVSTTGAPQSTVPAARPAVEMEPLRVSIPIVETDPPAKAGPGSMKAAQAKSASRSKRLDDDARNPFAQ